MSRHLVKLCGCGSVAAKIKHGEGVCERCHRLENQRHVAPDCKRAKRFKSEEIYEQTYRTFGVDRRTA